MRKSMVFLKKRRFLFLTMSRLYSVLIAALLAALLYAG